MKKENAFLQKLDKIGNLTQVVCLSLFLTGVSVQGVSAETGFPISQSVQQTKTVTGQVVDETGEPVIGASVVVEGTTNGTITDFDGRFALQVPSGKKVVISFVGYVPQTIAPKQGKDFRVVLKEDSKMLDEVVVVGYGTIMPISICSNSYSVAMLPLNLLRPIIGASSRVFPWGG